MIQDLKADSANWQRERSQGMLFSKRLFAMADLQGGALYEDSRVRESMQYWGPSEGKL